jgi:hypothetical protein
VKRALLFLVLLACEDASVGTETVSLSWSFGAPGVGCDASGVRTVHVFIGPLAPSGFYDQELRCKAGETGVTLHGVSPGRHVLVLKGLAQDKVLYTLTQDLDVRPGDLGTFVLGPYAPP